MGLITGIIGTLTGDKPSHWSNYDYSVYKIFRESGEQEWNKAKRMAKGRFNIDFQKISNEDKVKMFSDWAKTYFRTEKFNPEVGLPERFEAYVAYIEDQSMKYSSSNLNEILDNMCKRKMEEAVQANKWR